MWMISAAELVVVPPPVETQLVYGRPKQGYILSTCMCVEGQKKDEHRLLLGVYSK